MRDSSVQKDAMKTHTREERLIGPPHVVARSDRFVSYLDAVSGLHRVRIWGGSWIFAGLALLAALEGSLRIGVVAAIAAIVAAHAIWRRRSPGLTPDDSVHLDNLAILTYLAVLTPPPEAVFVGLVYMLALTVLFMTVRSATWTVSYILLGTAAIRWAFPADPLSEIGTEVSAVFLVAGLPPMAWILGQLARALGGRRRMSTQLELATARFERLFARSVVPMFRSDPDGRLIDANLALMRLFAAPDLEALQTQSLHHRWESPEQREAFIESLTESGQVQGLQTRFRRLDGSMLWGMISASLIETDDGPVIEGVVEDITEQREAEDQARLNAAVYEQLGSAVVVSDPERRVMAWNKRAEELFGFNGETIGRLSSDIFVGAEAAMVERVREQVAATGRWEGEAEILGPDGKPIPMAVSSTLVKDSNERPVGFSMVFTDLSDVQRAKRRLRFQANLLQQVHSAVIATDTKGVVRYWNRAAERLYGWTSKEAIGRPADQLTLRAAGREEAGVIMEAVQRTGAWQGEFEATRRNGSTFPALVSIIGFHDSSGEPAGLVGVSTDLTQIRKAEGQARRAERLGRAVLDSVSFPVAVISDDAEIIDVNQAWTRFALENDADMDRVGVGVDYLEPIRAALEDQPGLAEVVAGVTDVLEGRSSLFTHRYPCHSPGKKRWFETQVTPIPDIGAVVAHIDLTAEVRIRQILENTVREKDQFLATVSHELRTPLTAVLGFAEQLRAGDVDPDERESYFSVIAEQAREVADLVEDLLLAGRLDTDTIAIRPEDISATEIIRSVIRPWIDSVDFAITGNGSDDRIYADPLRTRQILRNLVTNAFRHGAAPFEICLEQQSSLRLIHVIDHGTGVPPGLIDHLYEPYTEASVRHGQPGSVGLGLYVSHQLAELMEGTLAHQRRDGTTIFTLALPVTAEDPPGA